MQPPFSRHAGFFASLHRVEHRLASEQCKEEERPFSGTMTASPLLLLDDPAPPAATAAADGDSSGPALDLLTLTTCRQEPSQAVVDDDDDIARLMALLGLSPPRDDILHAVGDGDGCDCSGPDGFLAKIVGVVGPKCDREHRRLDAWIHHYHRGSREPARLAHLLLAKASGDTVAAFPATVKGFLDRDAPPEE